MVARRKRLTFATDFDAPLSVLDVFVMNADGTGLTNPTRTAGISEHPLGPGTVLTQREPSGASAPLPAPIDAQATVPIASRVGARAV